MAELQMQHRMAMNLRAADVSTEGMRREFSEARVGQICAVTIGLAFIGAGVYVASHGNPWPGALLGGGGVGLQALVSTFVRGRSSGLPKNDLPEKKEQTAKDNRRSSKKP